MKKTGFVALLAASALALSACGGGDTTDDKTSGSKGTTGSESTDAPAEATTVKPADYLHADYADLKQGGTLTLETNNIAEQQNPFHQDADLYVSNAYYWYNPQMALFDDEGNWSFNPDYLTDVTSEEVDGNTVVTFTIRDEAVYNNGEPIDWRAFENTWIANRGTDKAYLPSSTDGYSKITSVEKGDTDKVAVVTFDGIYAWWQGLFNMLLNPNVNSAELFENAYRNTLHPEWGAGPYKVDKFDPAAGTISFVPNENWWGDPGKLDKMTYVVMESQASLNAFLNGEIDATGVANAERYTAVKDMEGIKIFTSMYPSNSLLMLNSGNEILADIKVRQAIFEGIDRSVLANIRFNGLDYTESAPGSFTLFQTQPGYEDNFSKAVSFDPEAAKSTLEEAGWTEGSDGIREKDGQKLSLRYVLLGDSPVTQAIAVALQESLKQIGVDLQIDQRPSSEFNNVYTSKDFDVFMMGFSSSDPFGVAYFGQIYASDSGLNLSGTGTPEFDKKIEEMTKIGDPEEQIKAANELEVEAFKLYGIMPMFNGPSMTAVKDGLANIGSMGFAVQPKQNIGWVDAK